MFEIKMSREMAQEVFDFIVEHLEVINETPNVETFMIVLEGLLED